jgi:hypothetical protein
VEWVNLPIAQGGLATVVLGMIVAIVTGRLLPRWWVEQLRQADRLTIERQAEEIREWRSAFIASEKTNRELTHHVRELIETGKVTEQLIRSVSPEGGES